MSSYFSTYFGNLVLNAYFNGTLYVGLLDEEPGVGGSTAGEDGWGLDYERQPTTWSSPSSKTVSNVAQMDFDNLDEGTVRWIAVFNAALAGQMIAAKDLATPVAVTAGGRFLITPGDIAITM